MANIYGCYHLQAFISTDSFKLPNSPKSGDYYHPHFTEGETEAQRLSNWTHITQ